jgi:hypothetical protein
MMGRVAQRIVLIAVALAICVCLVAGLRAARLQAHGERPLGAGAAERAAIEDRLDALRDASRFNPDPTPEIREAQVLVLAHRDREAIRILEDVVAGEPKNYEAWLALRQAAFKVDPPLSLRATRAALRLNPLARAAPRDRR